MDNLQENLISGVVNAAGSTTLSAEDVSRNQSRESDADTSESSTSAVSVDTNPFDEAAIDRFADRIIERIRQAEENGFKKAVEKVRQNPEQFGITSSVPNFLADIRPDIWEN